MLSDRSLAYWQRIKWIEAFVLLLAIPILLFPERLLLLTALVLALLATLWLAPLAAARSPLLPPTPFNAALLILAAALIPAILATADPDLTLPKATGIILGFAAWRYMVIALRRRQQVSWALGAYLLFGVGLVCAGLLNADWLQKSTSQVPVLGTVLAQGVTTDNPLLAGTGIHPNQIAGTIMLILPLLIAVLIDYQFPHNKTLRWLVGAAALFCAAALLLTQSRSGWVGLAGGVVVMLLLWSMLLARSAKRTAVRLLLLAGMLAVLLFFFINGPRQMQQLWFDPPDTSAVGSLATLNFRQDIWPWALRAIADFPYTGTGLGTFRRVAGRLYPVAVDPAFDFAHAHNAFLQVALDVGLPGLVGYSAILLLCAAVGWRIARGDKEFRPYAIGLLGSLAAFHTYGLADTLALGSKPFLLFWVLIALLAAMIRLR
ncbi:MAG: O-antigen ligase family protein [Candidatus Promineifilaceae bacterium]